MNLDLIRESIKREEGLRLEPYRCSKNHLTVGYGHKLTGGATSTPITLEFAESLFEVDLQEAIVGAGKFCGPVWDQLSDARQHCLIDMAFNMGAGAMQKFRRLRSAVRDKDWIWAGYEIKSSQYWHDVPNRAVRNYVRMLTGEEPE